MLLRRNKQDRNEYLREVLWKIFFLLIPLLLLFLFCQCLPKKTIQDYSHGRFPETFRTTNILLQKELLSTVPLLPIDGLVHRNDLQTALLLRLHHQLKTKGPDSDLISKIANLCAEGKKSFHFFYDLSDDPETAVLFPDLFELLQERFQENRSENSFSQALDLLEIMYDFSLMLLNSDQPDLFYFKESLSASELLAEEIPSDSEDRIRLQKLFKKQLQPIFSQKNIFRKECMMSMRDFEKMRLNGLRLFSGEQEPWSAMKESLRNADFQGVRNAANTLFRDRIYDVDKDQIQSLRIYKRVLLSEEWIEYQRLGEIFPSGPDRFLSIRNYRALVKSIREQTDVRRRCNALLMRLTSELPQ